MVCTAKRSKPWKFERFFPTSDEEGLTLAAASAGVVRTGLQLALRFVHGRGGFSSLGRSTSNLGPK